MAPPGLRERKKERTRRLIAEAAARLFAEHGYEQVSVIDVARAADVAEQTVYNYFPTKEQLVLDRAAVLRERLVDLILTRSPGVSPAGALRDEALTLVAENATLPVEQIRGGLGYLATLSPMVRRLGLEMTDELADALTTALQRTTGLRDPDLAKLHAIALAWVFQTITDATGRYARLGHTPAQIADELRPTITAMLDELDRWSPEPPAGGGSGSGKLV